MTQSLSFLLHITKSVVVLLTNMVSSVCADHQSCQSLVYITFYFHLCHRYFGDAVVRSGDRWMVEKWAVLGYWRCFCSPFCSVSRPTEGLCWYWHKFHRHIQVLRRCKFWGALCIQVDIPSDSANYTSDHQSSGCCCWHLRCYQQWLPIMGALIWKAFLCILGYCTLIPLSERIDGSAKSNPNNCDSVVNPSRIHILTSMGAHWSIFGKG